MKPQAKRVLFIDDYQEALDSYHALFRHDYEVYVANSAEQALRILNKTEIQVIICDQLMPDITGVEFFKHILDTHPRPIRILISAYSDYQAVVDAINIARIKEHIPKPCPNFRIQAAIDSALKLYYEHNGTDEIKRKIFISHSSRDIQIVRSFVNNILKLGLHLTDDDIFFSSSRHATIKTGNNFRDVIKTELINSKAVIQIITGNYKKSEICLNEMGAAWVLNNNVIPFILDPVTDENVGFIHGVSQVLKLNDRNAIFKFIRDFKGELFEDDIDASIETYIDDFVQYVGLLN